MVHLLLIIIYLSFISLGLPDALLGAVWPAMYTELGAPVSSMGIITMIIAGSTIISSLMSARLTRRLGTGKVTALSVAVTAVSLFGFSTCRSFGMLCLWAVPYGLGAGCVDASLNNYVALHYTSRHMSWLHCMWGVGASAGPYIMGAALTGGHAWNAGYRWVSLVQIVLTAILFLSLPLWKKPQADTSEARSRTLSIRQALALPGAREVMAAFFCYCAVEQTAGIWASSYLALHKGLAPDTAAFLGSMFFTGITIGRAFNGFLTFKFSDTQLVRLGQTVIGAGILCMLLPLGQAVSIIGLILIGLGCAPVYPCIIHSTPVHFGAEKSQALIGMQMASAYLGTCLMPSLFGLLSGWTGLALLPLYLLILLAVMTFMHERLVRLSSAGPA